MMKPNQFKCLNFFFLVLEAEKTRNKKFNEGMSNLQENRKTANDSTVHA